MSNNAGGGRAGGPEEARLSRFADWLERWSVTRLLAILANFGIIVGVFGFVVEMKDRTDERTFHAWDILSRAACGNSGKIQAAEFLNKDSRPWFLKSIPETVWPLGTQQKLIGIDLSKDTMPQGCSVGVFMEEVDLTEAQLAWANFSGAALWKANLAGADLWQAQLVDVDFYAATFKGALLKGVNLSRSKLTEVDLTGADLSHAVLKEVDLSRAKLDGVVLDGTDLTDIWAWADREPTGLPASVKLLICNPASRKDYDVLNKTGLPKDCKPKD